VKRLFVVLVVVLAAGCATVERRLPLEDATAAWELRQSRLNTVKVWDIQGRLSARTPHEGWQASLRWVRDHERHHIDLWGPLGRGHVRLIQDHSGATLQDADLNTYWAENGQQLLFETTGYWLPLDGLNYWVLGVPVPELAGQHALDESGRLRTLQQLGWDIRFLRYKRAGVHEFPSKVFIRRQLNERGHALGRDGNSNAPTLEVRLVIERWTLNP
jgi:outer membrane lipoprotein LolB